MRNKFKSDFLRILDERGFLHQTSSPERLDALLQNGPVASYHGVDATAPSMHVGHLVGIMSLYWLQQTGHAPIVLIGGGTTRIGDPSGKDESRKLLDPAEIDSNIERISKTFGRFLAFGDGPNGAVMVNNAEWLLDLKYIDFLRDVGQHFSVSQMIQRDSVRLRLKREQHLSLLEFNYMALQAYDFLALWNRYACRLQIGGSDQWGNMVSGIDLVRRISGFEVFALTTHLITTASGAKMGKTAAGAVWLDAGIVSPYAYWQFWRNTGDTDVGRFLKLFTTLPLDEIARLEALQGAEINEAKRVLANEATALLHGSALADEAAETARKTFDGGALGDALPSIEVTETELEGGLGLLTAVVRTGLAASNSEARRHVRGNALRVNDTLVMDETMCFTLEDIGSEGIIKLSIGKKRHALIRLKDSS